MNKPAVTMLYRPVGPAELAPIAASGWRSFPLGGREHLELWVPADALAESNLHIVGLIRVARQYGGS